jgi:hypothetical protein
MRKISAEMPSNLQQSHLGMESNESIALDVATMIGAGCTVAAARRVIGGCVPSCLPLVRAPAIA